MSAGKFAEQYLAYLKERKKTFPILTPNANFLVDMKNALSYYPSKEDKDAVRIQGEAKVKELKKEFSKVLEGMRIDKSTSKWIVFALSDFKYLIHFSQSGLLKELNALAIKKLKKAIKHMEALLQYPYLTEKCRIILEGELDLLKHFNKFTNKYSPGLEVAFYKMYIEDPQAAQMMILTPLKGKRGKFEKLFYEKALAVVLNDLLTNDSDKIITIMSRFLKKNVTHKDLENWLYLSLS